MAAWDGSSWSALGGGTVDFAQSLCVHDADGAGPQPAALFLGTEFTLSGSQSVQRWTGAVWQSIASSFSNVGRIDSLVSFDADDDGPAAPKLVATGSIYLSNPSRFVGIASWDGTTWSQLATVNGGGITELAQFDADGAGPQPPVLIGAGIPQAVGTTPVANIASWNGSVWSAFPGGFNSRGVAMAPYTLDDNGLPRPGVAVGLDVGGSAAPNWVRHWDGTTWRVVGSSFPGTARAMTTWDPDGAGPVSSQLVVGGYMQQVGTTVVNGLIRWDGVAWRPFGSGLLDSGGSPNVSVITIFDHDANPSTPDLVVAAGVITSAGGVPVSNIAAWNGTAWSALGSGFNQAPEGLAVFDADGNGPAPAQLYACGEFTLSGSQPLTGVARWNGTAWEPVGSAFSPADVNALFSFDEDGAGPAPAKLLAGGPFTTIGGTSARRLAAWDGSNWQEYAGGIPSGFVSRLSSFYPDGNTAAAPQLIIAGSFPAGVGANPSVAAAAVARYQGGVWRALDIGVNGNVNAIASLDPDGPGPETPRLLLAGDFSKTGAVASAADAGGQPSAYFAQWGNESQRWAAPANGVLTDGSSWQCATAPTSFDRLIFNATAGSTGAYTASLGAGSGLFQATALTVPTDDVALELSGNDAVLLGGAPSTEDVALLVGNQASASAALTIRSSSGSPSAFTAASATVGETATTSLRTNRLTVREPGTSLVINGPLTVSRRANEGRLVIQNSGTVTTSGILAVGNEVGSVGAIDIIGAGSTLLYGSLGTSAGIGVNGSGSMTISAGGVVYSAARMGFVTVGTLAGGTASVTITGAGSAWNASQTNLSLGHAGDASVLIDAGGQLLTDTTTDLYVSRFAESASTVTLRSGGLWREATAPIRIGPLGTIDVGSGATVQCSDLDVTSGGLLTGEGTVDALTVGGPLTVNNGGEISPRSASGGPSVLTLSGSLTQSAIRDGVSAAGTIGIDIAGTGAGQCDRIDLTGSATLSGKLEVRLAPGFDPPIGSRFHVLTAAGGVVGRFDVGYFPGLSGRVFRIDYVSTAARSVTSVDIVVESQGARGTFSDSTYTAPGAPSSAALGNLNADAFPDLVLTIPDATSPESNPGQVAVLINSGVSGSNWNGFVPSSQVTFNTGRLPASVAIARLRGNAQPNDLAVACAGDNQVQLFNNNGAAAFSSGGTIASGGLRPLDVDTGDFTGDGVADLAVVNYGDINPPPSQQLPDRGNIRILTNSGSGAFTLGASLVTSWYPRALAVGDFNQDDVPDIATADSGTSSVSVFIASTPGAWQQPKRYLLADLPIDIQPGNIDNSKSRAPALVVTTPGASSDPSHSITLLLNADDGTGNFSNPISLDVGGTPSASAIIDLDADGDQDIAVIAQGATPGSSSVRLLRNITPINTTGSIFALEPTPLNTNNPQLLLAGDVDQDGREDLVAIDASSAALRQFGTWSREAADAGGIVEIPSRTSQPPQVAVSRARPPCQSDVNGDHTTNTLDLGMLLSHFGLAVPAGTLGDITGPGTGTPDGIVNTLDLGVLLSHFGQQCP